MSADTSDQPGVAGDELGEAGSGGAAETNALDAPPPGDGGRRRRRRLGGIVGFVADKGIPLLIAVLGLVAALATTWGAVATSDANDLEDANTSLERQVDGLDEENGALLAEVETLTEQRDRWRERAQDAVDDPPATEPEEPTDSGDDGDGTTPVTTPAPPRSSAVFRQTGNTPLTFSSGYAVDLDSDAPDWGVSEGSSGDVYFYLASDGPFVSAGEVSLVDHVPTEAECDDATVLHSQLPQGETRQGLQICLHTDQDRWAYLRIAAVDTEARTISLDIIVWE